MKRLRVERTISAALCAVAIGCVAAVLPSSASAIGPDGQWDRMSLTYTFLNGTDDIPGNQEHDAVRQAMGIWMAANPALRFVETSAAHATIHIRWTPVFPGYLAEADFPSTMFSPRYIDFSSRHTWTTDVRTDGAAPYDLVTVAAHELGHSLGLTHSDPQALMRNGFPGSQRHLAIDDIARLNSLYPREGGWSLRNSNSYGGYSTRFLYGPPAYPTVAGDWNGDGIDTPGIYNPANGNWHLRNSNTTGAGDHNFAYGGGAGTIAVVGDWNGDGIDTPGIYNPANGLWHLRNSNTGGSGEINFVYGGGAGTMAVVGDWNGDGIDTPGIYNPANGNWHLRNSNTTGSGDLNFLFGGGAGTRPVAGDWNNDGYDTIGVFNPANSFWHLRNSNSTGAGDVNFPYGGGGPTLPVVGDWDGTGGDSVGTVF